MMQIGSAVQMAGWCVYLGNALISWKYEKPNKVTKSYTKAEYHSMSSTCSEIVWLRPWFKISATT